MRTEAKIGRHRFSARATVASAEERERLWPVVNRPIGIQPLRPSDNAIDYQRIMAKPYQKDARALR